MKKLLLSITITSIALSSTVQADTFRYKVPQPQLVTNDWDGDGEPNITDTDDDNDGILDVNDNDPYSNRPVSGGETNTGNEIQPNVSELTNSVSDHIISGNIYTASGQTTIDDIPESGFDGYAYGTSVVQIAGMSNSKQGRGRWSADNLSVSPQWLDVQTTGDSVLMVSIYRSEYNTNQQNRYPKDIAIQYSIDNGSTYVDHWVGSLTPQHENQILFSTPIKDYTNLRITTYSSQGNGDKVNIENIRYFSK